jgi:hypothetical protein
LIGNFQDFAITHIRRENNADADRLAKQAIDRATREKPPVNHHPSEPGFLESTVARVSERLGDPARLVPLEQPG